MKRFAPILLSVACLLAAATGAFAQCPGGVCPLPQRPGGWDDRQGQRSPPIVREESRLPALPGATAKLQDSVCHITNIRQAGNVTKAECGSGTIVAIRDDQALILTAKHVCPPGSERIDVRFGQYRGRVWSAKLITTHPAIDLAVIAIRADQPFNAVPLGDEPRPGTQALKVGFPGGGSPREGFAPHVGAGTVTGYSGQWCNMQMVSRGGESGGIIFADGKLVGVLCQGDDAIRLTQAIRANEIKQFFAVKSMCWWFGGGSGPPPTQRQPPPPEQAIPFIPVQGAGAAVAAAIPDVDSLKSRVTNAEGIIDRLRTDVQGLAATTGDQSGKLGKLDSLLAKVQDRVETVKGLTDGNASKADALAGIVDKVRGDVQAAITATGDHSGKLAKVDAVLAKVQDKTDNLGATLEQAKPKIDAALNIADKAIAAAPGLATLAGIAIPGPLAAIGMAYLAWRKGGSAIELVKSVAQQVKQPSPTPAVASAPASAPDTSQLILTLLGSMLNKNQTTTPAAPAATVSVTTSPVIDQPV